MASVIPDAGADADRLRKAISTALRHIGSLDIEQGILAQVGNRLRFRLSVAQILSPHFCISTHSSAGLASVACFRRRNYVADKGTQTT